MDVFPRVFLHVDAGEPDSLFPRLRLDVDISIEAERELILADLVTFGEVWIEIVFPRPAAGAGDFTMGGQPSANSELDNLFIEHRQDPGESHADRAGVLIGLHPKAGRTAAEDL